MAGTIELSKFLNDAEYSEIPEAVRHKIENQLQSHNKDTEKLKSKYEKLRVNSEQQYFEVEKQLISSNTKLESESSLSAKLKEQVAELEKKYDEATDKLKAIQESEDGNLSTKLHLTKANEQLESEKRDLAMILEKRNREIDNLTGEVKELSKKLSDANTAKCEALAKLDEANSNQVNKEYQIKRIQQEKDNLQSQIDWLNKDLNLKSKELMTIRREQSSKMLEQQAKLEEKTEECSMQQATVEALKKTNSAQTTKIDTLIQRIKDIQDSNSQTEEQYRQEIQARVRLVDLYKNASEEAENKATELTGAVTELQKLLQESATAHTELENEKDDEIEKWKTEIEKREKRIGNLEQELVNANDLLSAMKHKGLSEEKLETMFPTAAATSKLLKSGMSLTQIYNEYVQATDSLQLEKEENKRLNTYLDQILKEIELKAPLLKKQREDYDIALKSIDQMTRQLDAAMVDCQTLRSETDESHRKSSHFQKENQRQQQQIKDLSSQVKYLVKEVEELQGGRVVRDEVSSAEVSSSSRIITDKLVTFRNIEELQEQNQKLLTVIRELSDKKESEENEAVDAKTRELGEQLEAAQEELVVLKDARMRQAEMVESIVRQRDMYRVLLQQANAEPAAIPGQPAITDTKSPGPSMQKNTEQEKKLEEAGQALKQLQADFTSYKKEKFENEKLLKEQTDRDRQEISDLRLQNAKLSSQLDFAAERYKVLQGNADGYRKEIATLRDKIQKYNTSVAKYEQKVDSLRQDLMTAQEQLSQAQVREENHRREKDIIRSAEMRLSAELESMRRERNSQTMLMANLQAIQNNLERNEQETKQRLGKQLESLEREKIFLNRRLDTEDRHNQAICKHLESQLQEVRKSVELEMKEHQKTKDQQSNTRQQLQDANQLLESTTAKLNAAEHRLSNLSAEESGIEQTNEEIRDLKSQLDQSKSEVGSFQAQLDKSRKHVEQYKTIADTLQQTIKEQNQTSTDFKESLEEKLREANEETSHLKERVENLEQERQELLNENIRITEESHNLNADLRKQLASLQNEHQESIERRETAIAVEMSARQECENQTKVAAEAQDKYERELMLHAADVEALSAVKKELESYNTNLSEKEERANKAEKNLQESKKSWEQREKLLIEEKERLGARVTDLINQTRALHDQMGKLSTQVITVQERAAATPVKGGKPQDDSSKSSEQLLEVIKFIRKEKDIAEGKLDVVETECSRLKLRCDALEKQVESANTDLVEERGKAQTEIQTAAQHADLMHKVESLNLLQDSNKMLREEKEQLQAQVIQYEAKFGKLEEKIKPLQDEMRELQAQKESLTIDKKSALAEVERWRARTSQLIEQSHKTDPEEHKRLIQEKEELRKQMTSLTEDLHKAKAEATKASIEVAKSQRQLTLAKEEQTKISDDLKTAKDQLEERSKDSLEKFKTITQLKKIGRKYKEQAENITKEFEEVKTKHQSEIEAAQQALNEQIAQLEQKVKEAESKMEAAENSAKEHIAKSEQLEKSMLEVNTKKANIEESLKEYQIKKVAMEQQLMSLTSEKQQLEQRYQSSDKMKTDLTELQQENKRLKEETAGIAQLREDINKVKEEKAELDKKLAKANGVLQTAKTKLHNMKELNDKLTTEKNDMKKKLDASSEETDAKFTSMKSMFENQVQKLEKDLATKTEECSELQSKNQQLQSSQKMGAGQTQVQSARATGAVAAERISSSTSELPKMANIRPIASSPAGIKPQTVPVQPQSAASKATASIRPMAIAPTSVSPLTSTSGTPTATVMPTTVSQQEQQMEGEAVSPVQQLFPQQSSAGTSRPTQQVQRVIPTQEVTSQEPIQDAGPSTETGIVEPQPSSSRETPVVSVQQTERNKRSRDEIESPNDDSAVKRSKVTNVEESQVIPEIRVTDESAPTRLVPAQSTCVEEVPSELDLDQGESQGPLDLIRDTIGTDEQDIENDVTPSVSDGDIQEQPGDRGEEDNDVDDDGDAVIIVGSEEEEDEAGEDDEEEEEGDEEEDEGDEDVEVEENRDYDEDIATFPYSETVGDEMEEGVDGDYTQQEEGMQAAGQEEEDDDDDDVVIIEMGEEEGAMDAQEPVSQASSQPSSQPGQSLLPPLQPLASTERQLSVPRNQLTPFVLGSTAGFEDLDDCTVPSTPTLNVPRRGDGFAEAVSSPQVSQRFIFGSGGEHNLTLSGLAQLDSQAGMGMDDTRMDLSQLEEGSGRSVPSTPLHTSAPVTIISDMGEAGSSDTQVATSSQADSQGQDETDQGALVEDILEGDGDGTEDLEGELGEEDFPPEDLDQDEDQERTGADGTPEASSSQADASGSSSGLDRSQDANKPKIQKIVWDAPVTQAVGMPIQTVSMPIQSLATSPVQQFRPRGGPMRGMPPSRGNRGAFQRGQTRRPMRGGRGGGGMYTRRPPMF